MDKIRVYVYGAGNEYKKLKNYLLKYDDIINVLGILLSNCDGNKTIDGKQIYKVSDILESNWDYIIISVVYWEEIYEKLKKSGIQDEKIILGASFYDNDFDFIKYIENKGRVIELDYYKKIKIRDREYCKKDRLHYPPDGVTIGVTSGCPNKCLFCSYHGEQAKGNSEVYNIPFMLSYYDFTKMVDMANEAEVSHIHICGTGEPFVNPDILKMIDYVCDTRGGYHYRQSFMKRFSKKRII